MERDHLDFIPVVDSEPAEDQNVLYQYSTAAALMAGVASNGTTLTQLLSHGDHGLGTMRLIQGEVVFLDGAAYHLHPSGEVKDVEDEQELPFAMVTRFHPQAAGSFTLESKAQVLDRLLELYPHAANQFICFRVSGIFDSMRVRVVQGQKYERQPLSELGDAQKEFSLEKMKGDIIGFWTPEFMDGVSVAGLHMHFLSDDRKNGGHILSLKASQQVNFRAAIMKEFRLGVPSNSEYNSAKFSTNKEALHKVEG